jgi:hypothetical protein
MLIMESAMSLRPDPIGPVPEETAGFARAAFPHGTAWMRLRDELGPIYPDDPFAPLFSQRARPAEAPCRLTLVSVMQFAERLSDRRAADAARGRIDWMYALGLPLEDPGFDSIVYVSSAAGWLKAVLSSSCSIHSSPSAVRGGGCMHAAVSGPTRRTYWPLYTSAQSPGDRS